MAGVKVEVSASPAQLIEWLAGDPKFWSVENAIAQFLREASGIDNHRLKGPVWCELLLVRLRKRRLTCAQLIAEVEQLRSVDDVDELLAVAVEDPVDQVDRTRSEYPMAVRWFTKEDFETALS